MNVLLDSSYFFPMIGVTIEKSPTDLIPFLTTQEDIKIFYSPITLFELSAKGGRLVNKDQLEDTNVIDGINAITSWKKLTVVDLWLGEVQRLAFDFRLDHSDYIDCLILASAIIHANVFVSEDTTLKKLLKTKWLNRVRDVNIEFEILNTHQLKDKINEIEVNSETLKS